MSVQRLHSRDLLFPLLLCVSALALFASIAQAEDRPSRLGLSWGVQRIHSEAREGDTVTLEGRVVSISRSRFFTLQDPSRRRQEQESRYQKELGNSGFRDRSQRLDEWSQYRRAGARNTEFDHRRKGGTGSTHGLHSRHGRNTEYPC